MSMSQLIAQQRKYTLLMLTLITILLTTAFVAEEKGVFLLSVLLLTAIVLMIRTFYLHQRTFYLYIGLALVAGLCDLIYLVVFDHRTISPLAIAADTIYAGFLLLSIVLITHKLFTYEAVSGDIIVGGICVYLLMGNLWFLLYDNLSILDVNAFSAAHPIDSFDLLYFSFTTLTTVGYGDIVPVSQVARVFANLEAIVGVMFPAIFIALLVGQYNPQRTS